MGEQQAAGAGHCLQARGDLAQAGVQQRQAGGWIRVFAQPCFDLGAQGLQGFQQAPSVAADQGQRLMQLGRQQALAQAMQGLVLARPGAQADQQQGGQVTQCLLELHPQGIDVLAQGQLQLAAHLAQCLGQFVEPTQVAQIHGTRKLAQGNRWQVVTLVEHQQAVVQLGQGLHAHRSQHQIVVCHDHLGLGEAAAGLVVAAVAVARAVPPGAGVPLGGHSGPVTRVGLLVQAVPVTVPAVCRQGLGQGRVKTGSAQLGIDATELLRKDAGRWRQIFIRPKKIIVGLTHRASLQAFEFEFADIAAPALGQGKGKRRLEHGGQRRQVFAHELLLQRHGGC